MIEHDTYGFNVRECQQVALLVTQCDATFPGSDEGRLWNRLDLIAAGGLGVGPEEFAGEGSGVLLCANPGEPESESTLSMTIAAGRLNEVAPPSVGATSDVARIVALVINVVAGQ